MSRRPRRSPTAKATKESPSTCSRGISFCPGGISVPGEDPTYYRLAHPRKNDPLHAGFTLHGVEAVH